jgi:hypothetical protein
MLVFGSWAARYGSRPGRTPLSAFPIGGIRSSQFIMTPLLRLRPGFRLTRGEGWLNRLSGLGLHLQAGLLEAAARYQLVVSCFLVQPYNPTLSRLPFSAGPAVRDIQRHWYIN